MVEKLSQMMMSDYGTRHKLSKNSKEVFVFHEVKQDMDNL